MTSARRPLRPAALLSAGASATGPLAADFAVGGTVAVDGRIRSRSETRLGAALA